MSEAFLKVVNMSISAGWLVLAVLALRLILMKAPKWVNVLLWGIVAVRLICPYSIESALSLIPSAETISPEIMMDPTPGITTGIPALNSAINPIISDSFAPNLGDSANPLQILIPIASFIWILGVLLMLLYTVGSYLSLRQQLRIATRLRENIYQCVTVDSPFVLGILKPKIYLPYEMEGDDLNHVVAHEQAHIRRKDHWWKPLGFLLLTIHWFNPLMWAAYILLCRDIELACDEKVIGSLGNEQRADYTQALVACSVNRRLIAACPLAFGEVSVKERVKNVMNYKKPGFWLIVIAVVVCIVFAVCFLTDPFAGNGVLSSGEYYIHTMLYSHSPSNEENFVPSESYSVSENFELYEKNPDGVWVLLGKLEAYPLTNQELYSYNMEGWHRHYPVRKITDAYILRVDNDFFYLVFQTMDGNTYLAYGWEDVAERGQSGSDDTGLRRLYQMKPASTSNATKWFDYANDHSEMSYEEELRIQLDAFPGITFTYNPYHISDGDRILISGMPIWNAYFSDLTGDGLPEICAQVSYGSGIIDSRVIIFDYANGASYTLEDRGYHDYYLYMEEGYLRVGKWDSAKISVSSGKLIFKDGCIQVEGVSTDRTTVPDVIFGGNLNLGLNAKIIDIDPFRKILYVTDLDQSATIFGDRCAIDCTYAISRYNLLYVNYGDPNDVRTIDFSAFGLGDAVIIGMYDSELEKAFNGSAVAEQVQLATQKFSDTAVTIPTGMIPTDTYAVGLCNGALMLPMENGTYRYLLTETNPQGVTADELLFSFDETDIGEPIHHEVYSLKEYPDRSKVLLFSAKNGPWLCEYSPPQRCSDTALSDAIAAGYPVTEDGIATHGQAAWQKFYEQTQKGKSASITVAQYYTLDPAQCDSGYYEIFQQDYPCLYLDHLSYDGKQFTLTSSDGSTRTYEYLMKYETPDYSVISSQKPESSYKYVLTHDNSYTYEELWASVASSYYGAYIDHYTIYSESKQ